jgi:hypothetical protein
MSFSKVRWESYNDSPHGAKICPPSCSLKKRGRLPFTRLAHVCAFLRFSAHASC